MARPENRSEARALSLTLPNAVFVVAISNTIDGCFAVGTAIAMGLVLSSDSVPPHGGTTLALPTQKYNPIMFCAAAIRG